MSEPSVGKSAQEQFMESTIRMIIPPSPSPMLGDPAIGFMIMKTFKLPRNLLEGAKPSTATEVKKRLPPRTAIRAKS